MKFGRFGVGRVVRTLAISALMPGAVSTASAQVAPASSPNTTPSSSTSEGTVPALPDARPLSDAAIRTSSGNAVAAKAAVDAQGDSSSPSPLLRLGAGDLVEVSVYNVPELSTKARIGNSGDVYLPLIDYVHVGELTVEEAQKVIQKRLEDGRFRFPGRDRDRRSDETWNLSGPWRS
jgi:protein involved in polysaccharide export with SLBB domain